MVAGSSVDVEDLLHAGPPFAVPAALERLYELVKIS